MKLGHILQDSLSCHIGSHAALTSPTPTAPQCPVPVRPVGPGVVLQAFRIAGCALLGGDRLGHLLRGVTVGAQCGMEGQQGDGLR